jgi:hypothetical protein
MQSDVGRVEDLRGVVVMRLRARRGELEDAIFARVSGGAFAPPGGSGSSGAQDAEYVAGLRAAVGAAVGYGLEGIERGEERVGPVPVAVSEQARRAARVGVSLETVLRRYVVGHTLLEAFVMDEAERGEDDWSPLTPPTRRGVLKAALRAQASVLDRLLREITVAYGDELARAGRSPERRRYELVRGLIDGEPVESAGLDYELEGWHLGVIATGAGAALLVRELAVGVDRRLLSLAQGERSVWAWLGGRERLMVADVERFIGIGSPPPMVLALGEPAQGLEGWRLTHRQAQAALVVALRRNGIPQDRIPPAQGVMLTRYGDVALLAGALKDEALARALLEIYIAPLDDGRGGGPVLRATLRAYLAAEGSVSSAAAALGVVRRTVENRLGTIEQRLGRSLHPCPAELEVALELDELAASPGSPEISNIGEIVA